MPRRRAVAEHQRGEGKRPRRRQRRGRTRRAIPARPLRGRWRTGRIAPEHRQHRAVLALHPQQPVEAPFRFIQHVRHAVAAFGNAEIIAPGVRVLGIGDQQRPALVRRPVRVLIIVPGIIPAAAQVARRRGIVRRRIEPRLAVLSGPQMARRVGPARTRLRRRFRKARALVIEGPERLTHQRLVDIGVHPECRRHLRPVPGGHHIFARRRHLGDVQRPDMITRQRVDRRLRIRVEREGAHRRLGLRIPHIIGHARLRRPGRIKAGHRLAYTDDLRIIRPVAELVQHDRRGRDRVRRSRRLRRLYVFRPSARGQPGNSERRPEGRPPYHPARSTNTVPAE